MSKKKKILLIVILIVAVFGVRQLTKDTPRSRETKIEKILNKTYWIDEDYQNTNYTYDGNEVETGVTCKYEYYFYKEDGKLYCCIKVHLSDEDHNPVAWFYDLFKGEVEIKEDDSEGSKGTLSIKNSIKEAERYKSELDSKSIWYHYDAKGKKLQLNQNSSTKLVQEDEQLSDDSEFQEHDTLFYVTESNLSNLMDGLVQSGEMIDYIISSDPPYKMEDNEEVTFDIRRDYDEDKGIYDVYLAIENLDLTSIEAMQDYWESFMNDIYEIITKKLYYPQLEINLILEDEDYTAVYVYTKDGFGTDTSDVDKSWQDSMNWDLTQR